MIEDKPVHHKRRNGDPDGIALGKSLSMLLKGHPRVGSSYGYWFWYLLGGSASKGLRQEFVCHLLEYNEAKKYYRR